jgi:tRNA (adenine22-N1)-methyltransferase
VLRNSKRINTLIDLVPSSSQVVWDLCCDHGNIGLGIHESNDELGIIFVDQVDLITKKLQSRLLELNMTNLKVICKSATDVDYTHSKKSTFLIAGVGGDLAIKIITQILRTNSSKDNSFIVSPHSTVTNVREYLANTELTLNSEILVKDNSKYYEMLLLDFKSEQKVSKYGRSIWNTLNKEHLEYIDLELKHLSRKLKHNNEAKFKEKYLFYKSLIS